MIRGTDGLDYEDLAARVRGEPARTALNSAIVKIRLAPHADECEAVFRQTYAWAISMGRAAGSAEDELDNAAAMYADMKVSELRSQIAMRLNVEQLRTYPPNAAHDDRLRAGKMTGPRPDFGRNISTTHPPLTKADGRKDSHDQRN